jgi:hypothetical protein
MEIKMKGSLIILVTIVFFFTDCKKPSCFENAGPVVTIQRAIAPFHRINLFDDVDVILTQDTIESISVKAPKYIEPNISIKNENGVLTIRNNTTCRWLRNPSEKAAIYIAVKSLDYFEYSGSGNVSSSNTIKANNIKFYSATGAGNIDISLEAKQVTAWVEYESADFIFKGRADLCYCYANSRGTLQFEDFEVKHLVFNYAGNRNTTVSATERIEAVVYHTGNVYYKGNPSDITTAYYSSGRLLPKP